MANKFISFLEKVGHDFKKGLDVVLPLAATAGETAVSIFAPGLGPLFNSTVAAVITAEQTAASIGQQSGTGPQKLASVATMLGPLIKQTMTDLGKEADDAAVQKYISAVVTILNSIPAPAPAPAVGSTAPAPAAVTPTAPVTASPGPASVMEPAQEVASAPPAAPSVWP